MFAVFVGEIRYLTFLNVIIRPRKSYVVTRPKIFVYCKLGVAELKLERFPVPFGLPRLFNFENVKFFPLGTTKFTFRSMRVFQHLEG
jgi:hypothetical protein